jgi:phage-related protein
VAKNSTITVRLLGENRDLKAALDDSEAHVRGWAGKFAKIVAVGAGAAAISIAAGLGASVKQAVDLGESTNAVAVTFGQAAEGIKKLGEEAATAVGLSNTEFNGLAVQFSSFATKIAGPGGDVVQTIDDMTSRAADFASVMNLDVNEAAAAFQSGLAGENEPLKKFGIDLSDAAVKAYALANGITAGKGEMTEAQKVQARYGLLMEQTAKTTGDFANTSDSLANRQRVLSATLKNLAAKIGTALLPVLTELATTVAERVVPWLEDHLPAAIAVLQAVIGAVAAFVQRHWGSVLTVLAGVVGVGRRIVGFFRSNRPALIGLLAALAAAFLGWAASAASAAAATIAATAPVLAILAAVGLLVAGLVYAYQNFEWFRGAVDAAFTELRGSFRAFVAAFRAGGDDVTSSGMAGWFERLGLVARRFVDWFRENWPEIKAAIASGVDWLRTDAWPVVKQVAGNIRTAFGAVVEWVRENWPEIRAAIASGIEWLRDDAWPVVQQIAGSIRTAFEGVVSWVRDNWPQIRATIASVIDWIGVNVVPVIQAVIAFVVAEFQNLVNWTHENFAEWQQTFQSTFEAIVVIVTAAAIIIGAVVFALVEDILAWLELTWQTIKDVIEAALKIVRGVMLTVTALIRGDWGDAWEGIKTIVTGVWDLIKAVIGGALGQVKILLSAAWTAIKLVASAAWDGITGLITAGVQKMIDAVRGLPGGVAGVVKGAFDAIWTGFKSVVNRVIDAWNSLKLPGFTIGGWDPPGPGKFPSVTIPSIGVPNIPRLATGTVAFAPMLAMIGEYAGARSNPEIVAPRSTIMQTMRDVLAEQGSPSGPITLIIEGRPFTAIIAEHDRELVGAISQGRRG